MNNDENSLVQNRIKHNFQMIVLIKVFCYAKHQMTGVWQCSFVFLTHSFINLCNISQADILNNFIVCLIINIKNYFCNDFS